MVANSSAPSERAVAPPAPVTALAKAGAESSIAKPAGENRIFNNLETKFGDWRDDLVRDGFVVVKGAVPRERADKYAEQIYTFLETFAGGLGYKRDDPSTIKEANLPIINNKGMIHGYGVPHEEFAWAIRQEPGVVEAFERAWDTEDIIVSFDALNMAFPNREAELGPNKPWPHQDQDPEKLDFRALQGIVNLLPNGPNDGGLIVCRGAHLASEEFHAEFMNEENPVFRWTPEWYGFTEKGMAWLKEKGYEWVKIEAEPGDLMLWDSRTPHYNLSPEGTMPRFAAYTCYMPATLASQEDLIRKKDAFERKLGTSHWPDARQTREHQPCRRNGEDCPYDTGMPRKPVELTERGFKLTGIPYIRASA